MAKSQKRSNREVRKPKKDKKPAAAESVSGSKVKDAVSSSGFAKRTKG